MHSSAIGWAATAPLIEIREVDVSPEHVQIRVLITRSILFTSELPGFDRRLLNRLPQLLWTTICHNDHDLSFAEELRATEMGHVLEHVVLVLLTKQGIYAKGMTEWNWLEEPEGTFTITLCGDQFQAALVGEALAEAIEILEVLLAPARTYATPVWMEERRSRAGQTSAAQA